MQVKAKAARVHDAVIALPFCHLGLRFDQGKLVATEYLEQDSAICLPDTIEIRAVDEQLQAYSKNPHYRFQLNLQPKGTEFQLRVWQMLQSIPVGTVLSYGEMAKRLASSARAVGNACRANPLPLVIPCHRVVAASGLGGFAGARSGYLVEIKRQLLRHEGLEF